MVHAKGLNASGNAVPTTLIAGNIVIHTNEGVVESGSLTGMDSPTDSTTTGGTTFRYDATAGQFIYNLATDRKWAGGCRRVVVTLDDGTTKVANFRFR